MIASFIIYFHSCRWDNLFQTIQFLEEREPDVVRFSELVLICQDECDTPKNSFKKVKHIDLKTAVYNKPLMVNAGVKQSKCEKVVLLDSDRILPHGYFKRALCQVSGGTCISTTNLMQLDKSYSDAEIRQGSYRAMSDPRSPVNEMHCKNMFSGNTVMYRRDYLAAGGMDESFVGYGYNDNDFTKTMEKRGTEFIWRDEPELHLYHPKGLGELEMIRSNVENGIRYCNKWHLFPGVILHGRAKEIGVDLNRRVTTLKTRRIFL